MNLVRRNRPGANRKLDPATVVYYAKQMARDDWKATGQPILIDTNGGLLDAQHRVYAGLISGMTFKSFVVTDVEPIENLFAYIDNAKPRTAASALQTAGLNGVSPTIVKVLKIAEEVRLGVYNASSAVKLGRLSPVEVLKLSATYPNARMAARMAASDWSEASSYVGYKEIVAYLGMQIDALHDGSTADDFFEDVASNEERSDTDAIGALRKLIDKEANAQKPMKKHHLLAALIKAFNAWHQQEPLGRRWMLQVNEDFPVLVGPRETETEAA